MAFKAPKPIKSFEFKSGAAQAQYDWPTLLNGSIYTLKHNEHFDCKPLTFSSLARTQAGKAHKKLACSIDTEGGTVTIQATVMTAEEATAYDEKAAERKALKAAEKEAGKVETTEEAPPAE